MQITSTDHVESQKHWDVMAIPILCRIHPFQLMHWELVSNFYALFLSRASLEFLIISRVKITTKNDLMVSENKLLGKNATTKLLKMLWEWNLCQKVSERFFNFLYIAINCVCNEEKSRNIVGIGLKLLFFSLAIRKWWQKLLKFFSL